MPPRRWLAAHRLHLFFGVALAALVALIGWWALFIGRAVEERRQAALEILELRTRLQAALPSVAERGSTDEEIAISPCREVAALPHHPLMSGGFELCAHARPGAVAEIARRHRAGRLMVVGEAALSLLLVLVAGFMLFRLIAQENRSTRELRRFWGRVTHELKSPITGLKALLQTLQQQELDRSEMAPLLELGLAEVRRQELLAENLLIGHRLGGPARGPGERLQLAPFLRTFCSSPRLGLAPDAVSLSCSVPDDVAVRADPGALRTILDNLVDNALKYGGPRVRLLFDAASEGDWARLRVSDDGPGIPPGAEEAIFEAYRRLDAEGTGLQRQGTGMGLHVSRRLARELGGELHTLPGGPGATFVLSLRIEGG